MRPLEIALVVVNAAAFLLVVPRPWRRVGPVERAVLAVVAAAPVLALVQGLVEGPRWQLVPSYVVTGLLCGVILARLRPWLSGGPKVWVGSALLPSWVAPVLRASPVPTTIVLPTADRVRLAVRRGLTAAGIVLAVPGLGAISALPAVFPVFGFPPPAGPYGIGTVTYHWIDADRGEPFTVDPADRRELMVQVWYPARRPGHAQPTAYLEDAAEVAPALARLANAPAFALGHLGYVTTHAVAHAPPAGGSFPVLILLPGLGSYRQAHTFQVEQLVSQGYVVAAVDQPYVAAAVVFPDGRVAAYDHRLDPPHRRPGYEPATAPPHNAFADAHVPYLAADVTTVLDRLTAVDRVDPYGILTGALDLDRVGLLGHGLGGTVGATACLSEQRLRACLIQDAYLTSEVVRAGLAKPTMWISRDASTMRLERRVTGGWPDQSIDEHLLTMRAVYQGLSSSGYIVAVRGMFQPQLTDAPLMSPLAPYFGLEGPAQTDRVHAIVTAYSLAFFDRHLRQRPAVLLDGPPAYPEVRLESRHP